ncbi:hypothetical protein F5Y12DRAFT_179269 [Xylaria sp. FL1777]|nr:hypothetical protein F5Y12DRAFT_179269 [Xylaria sp. FL1777]
MSPITCATLAHISFRGFTLRAATRGFATSRPSRVQNQIYASVRRPADFHTYQLLSTSARTPLLTLWTTSWCSTCRAVAPLVRSLVEAGVGEPEGGVAFCVVEYDAPDIMAGDGVDRLGTTYVITSIPTLLSFDAGEPVLETRVVDGRKLADREFLVEWIRNEARRCGGDGNGGGGTGVLGGLFKGWR